MPIVDGQTVTVSRAGITGGVLSLSLRWPDGREASIEIPSVADLRRYLREQSDDDVMRAVLLAAFDRGGDAMNAQTFAALRGRTLRIVTNVVQV